MFRCLLQLKDISIKILQKYKFYRFWYPRHYRYRHPTSSFHAHWSIASDTSKDCRHITQPFSHINGELICYFPEAKLGVGGVGGGVEGGCISIRRWRWWWSGCYQLSQLDATTGMGTETFAIAFVPEESFTGMWRGNKLFICLRAYCLMSLFEKFSSFISSNFTFQLYVSWRCRNYLSSRSSECLTICSYWRKERTASLLNYKPWPDQLLNLIAFFLNWNKNCDLFKIKSVYNSKPKATSSNRENSDTRFGNY